MPVQYLPENGHISSFLRFEVVAMVDYKITAAQGNLQIFMFLPLPLTQSLNHSLSSEKNI